MAYSGSRALPNEKLLLPPALSHVQSLRWSEYDNRPDPNGGAAQARSGRVIVNPIALNQISHYAV